MTEREEDCDCIFCDADLPPDVTGHHMLPDGQSIRCTKAASEPPVVLRHR